MSDIKYPKGYKKGGHTQLAVRFEDKHFTAIVKRAKREKKSFNDMVLYLIKCGELCLDESDKLEEAA
jgi:hypothetical protein